MTASPPANPLRYDPSFEVAEEDEQETIERIIESMLKIGETVANDEGHAFRTVHAKSHGYVIGELEVTAEIPSLYAHGLFATPGRYPVVMRFSTTPGDLLSDKVSTPRGVAIKVVGVHGSRVSNSEGDSTQDFILVDGPTFSAPTAKKFVKNLKLLAATTDRMPRTKNALSAALRGAESLLEKTGHESASLKSMGGHPATHILGETFFSQVPLLYGPYIAKVALVPVAAALTAHTDEHIELSGHDDALREAVLRHFASAGGEWELRVQLCTNLDTMPVEDASVEWPQDESPYVTVGRVSAQPQSTWSQQRVAAIEDGMSFSPWHALAAHRPLGSVNRVRKPVYEAAARFRAQRNGAQVGEPRSLGRLAET